MNRNLAIGGALAGAVALGATIAAFSNAQTGGGAGAFDEKQKSEIETIVRDYLIANPEVILEAVRGLEERERARADELALEGARANLDALLADDGGFTIASDPAKARVAVIEMFDYHCGYCKRAMGLVQDLAREDAAVKVVFRELPVLREESELAARAALAARAQGKYAELHFAMMGASGVIDRARLKKIAADAGLDVARLEKDMEAPAVEKALEDTRRIADAMGVDGTPAFIIASLDGKFIRVVPGYSEEAIAEAIAEAKKS